MNNSQSENTAVSTVVSTPANAMPSSASSIALILNEGNMTLMFKFAELMAQGVATVPKHLQGKPADCLAVVIQATQWNMNPYAVAQKTHLVNGTLGYEAQLVNAVLKQTNSITGEFSYEYRGDGDRLECRVGAVSTGQRAITWGEWLCAGTVTTKNSPLWKTNPKQQLGYLQVKNWARAYHPGAILGVYTPDELETIQEPRDMGAAEVVQSTAWPDALFAERLPDWHKAIAAKKATADSIIGKAKTKYPLSVEQEAAIRAVPKPAVVADEDGVITMTYAQVADRISKSTTREKLDEVASLIGTVADKGHQGELAELYEARVVELNA
ncbi:recombinase RecT [Polaromonas sp.]|uniref:recombinase RecT n=1 Tax=Polaromonas sp. TaxID=1869339 RepID=UPI003267975A